jgi:hypothetical protein
MNPQHRLCCTHVGAGLNLVRRCLPVVLLAGAPIQLPFSTRPLSAAPYIKSQLHHCIVFELSCVQAYFRRAQLKALVGLHSTDEGLGGTLSADEISIITGALDLTSKTAWAAMTPLDKVRVMSMNDVHAGLVTVALGAAALQLLGVQDLDSRYAQIWGTRRCCSEVVRVMTVLGYCSVRSLLLLLVLLLQVFMLPADRRLDESTLQEILVSGHSRIPLHEPGDRCGPWMQRPRFSVGTSVGEGWGGRRAAVGCICTCCGLRVHLQALTGLMPHRMLVLMKRLVLVNSEA